VILSRIGQWRQRDAVSNLRQPVFVFGGDIGSHLAHFDRDDQHALWIARFYLIRKIDLMLVFFWPFCKASNLTTEKDHVPREEPKVRWNGRAIFGLSHSSTLNGELLVRRAGRREHCKKRENNALQHH